MYIIDTKPTVPVNVKQCLDVNDRFLIPTVERQLGTNTKAQSHRDLEQSDIVMEIFIHRCVNFTQVIDKDSFK